MNSLPSTAQLKLFVIYSECCDVSKTASQANVLIGDFYEEMDKLENVLDTKLFTHHSHNSQLTKDGKLFAKKAKELLTSLEDITSEFRNNAKDCVTINVGALLTMGDILLSQDIMYFESLYPNIKLQTNNQEASQLYQLLESDDLDVAILFGLDKLAIDLNKYESEPFFSESLVYYAPQYPKLGNTISLEEISQYPLVEYDPSYVMSAVIKEYLKANDIKTTTTAWFTSPYVLLSHCQQYSVGSFQCERLLNQFGYYEGYYHMEEDVQITYSIFSRKNSPKKEAIKIFLDFLRTKYKS